MIHGTESAEQTYSEILLEVFKDASDAALMITQMARGPVTSISVDRRALCALPHLEKIIIHEKEKSDSRICKIIDAYRNGEVSDEESREFADTLENARPRMFTYLGHPGMRGHSNSIETLIKRRVTKPRRMQVALPN